MASTPDFENPGDRGKDDIDRDIAHPPSMTATNSPATTIPSTLNNVRTSE